MRFSTLLLTISAGLAVSPAFSGTPAPLPIAGAAGPVGLAVVVAGYVGYRVLRRRK